MYLGLQIDGALLRARLRSSHLLDQHRALASAIEITGKLPPPTPDIQLAGPEWFRVMAMKTCLQLAALVLVAMCGIGASAQDLVPRAYVIAPVRSNAVILTDSFLSGGLLLEGAAPITDSTASGNIPVLTYYRSLGLFGRSANVTASLPYLVGHFKGKVSGADSAIYRSGLMDSVYRFSINLKGGPALSVRDFQQWRQKTLIGASLKVVAPTGQYDPTKLINASYNRWAFKPELGISRRWGNWLLDSYGSVLLFTTNDHYYSPAPPQRNVMTQAPIWGFEGHLSYDVRPRLWISLDGNYWRGGTTSVNGVADSSTLQANSRLGATFSVPVSRHQSIKISYSRGAYVLFGGNLSSISVAWQYAWIDKPK